MDITEDYKATPYRFNQLVKIAAKVTDTMVANVWHLDYDEMAVVLDMVRYGLEKSKESSSSRPADGPSRKGK